ncbi:MAG: aminoacyl-tRNA hydrolase [bacterium]
MHIIAGLGNPGRSYKDSRHNVGFMVLDLIARENGIKLRSFKYKGRTGAGKIEGEKVFLLKPRTYMNLSGISVAACLKGQKTDPSRLVVIHDDMDLPVGRIKVKARGGAGGHKGISSIIECLKTDEFARVRIGIGKPTDREDTVDYVLSPFSPAEKEELKGALEKGSRAVLEVVFEGADAAMNKFNFK